ncbi:hypothetical protein MCOR25_008330 [Pyricularia grisea]|uniref:Isotrichodermin C-15 hydroxylase n=1 Tax=Pyricularia grisea TaxID=148305 RepID=A0A6P8BFZ9_PYRGI|nr:uncharacterized protein PgNI_02068 [Pyricularia grisea]KAI6355125.1 hypothetical protein MCOR25_008330 [Pyricularia grisea]TLD15776.1 hypothetical protein PgNI_02068 [Pyricularia grisea]
MAQLQLVASILSFAAGCSISHCVVGLFLLLTSYLVLGAFYNVYFHSLSRYPGPRLWAASQIPYALHFALGDGHLAIQRLHQRYGKTVRVAPDRLSLHDPDAWQEVMGHHKDRGENAKAPGFYDPNNIVGADLRSHARHRKLLSVGFSARFLMEQQAVVSEYVGLMVKRLREIGRDGAKALDMVTWLNCTTFDIGGDVMFGESFGCLRNGAYHPWVALIVENVQFGAYTYAIAQFPLIARLIKACVPKSVEKRMEKHVGYIVDLVDKRLAADSTRLDLMRAMSNAQEGQSMSKLEIYSNTGTLVVAGAETTSSALSAILFYLLKTPKTLQKLVDEVRGAFETEIDIKFLDLQNLTYLNACIREGLRMYPPLATGFPRITPPQGTVLFGEYLPPKPQTIIDIWQWPMSRSNEYFKDADKYVPERWMSDPEYESDVRQASQPFSFGPRDCMGKPLAYAEMRAILAHLVWNFDMKLADDSKDWDKRQKVLMVWLKPPLNVYMKPVVRK